jgi:hypothetical protein
LAKGSGLEVFDLRDLLPDENFTDPLHLDDEGARRLGGELAQRLGSRER